MCVDARCSLGTSAPSNQEVVPFFYHSKEDRNNEKGRRPFYHICPPDTFAEDPGNPRPADNDNCTIIERNVSCTVGLEPSLDLRLAKLQPVNYQGHNILFARVPPDR